MTDTAVAREAAAAAAAPVLHVLGADDPPDPAAVGGKAASLDRLARLGADVPAGLCLTAAAERSYLEAAGCADAAHAACARLPDEGARRELEAMAGAHPLPAAVRAPLEQALARLGSELPPGARLAVRSSAVDEDGGSSSFAGAHESVLGVPATPAALEEAVRACWASQWSERAIAYREHGALGYRPGMAVVVQHLVEAVASAVAFTKDPVTGSEDEVVVSCCPGLGDRMMAGGGEATTWTVAKATRWVLDVDGAAPPVSREALDALVDAVVWVERAYGRPVDVEAAYADRAWRLVQARPITT